MIKFVAWLITCFISTFGFSYFYYHITGSKQKIDFFIVFVFSLGVLISTITRFYNVLILNSLSYFVYYPVLFYYLNPLPFKDLIFYVLIIWLYAMILDFTSMLLVSFLIYIFKLNVSVYLLSGIMTFVVCVLMILISRFRFIQKFTKTIYNVFAKINYPDFVLIMFTAIVFLMGMIMFINLERLSFSFILGCLIFLIVLNFIILIKYKINDFETNKFIKVIRDNNQFYINVDDEHRIFKHNLMAKLLSIQSVSNQKARLLISDLMKEFNKNVDFTHHIKDIPYGLNGILYQKIYFYLDRIQVKFDNDIHYDIFEVLTPRRYNVLVEKMVITLDNALESAINSLDKLLIINLYEKDNTIVIEIKNSFSDRIDLDNIGNFNYSTKSKKRGLGLFSALREKEVVMDIKVVNNMFMTKLEAKKNKTT